MNRDSLYKAWMTIPNSSTVVGTFIKLFFYVETGVRNLLLCKFDTKLKWNHFGSVQSSCYRKSLFWKFHQKRQSLFKTAAATDGQQLNQTENGLLLRSDFASINFLKLSLRCSDLYGKLLQWIRSRRIKSVF